MAKNIIIFSDGTGQVGGLCPDERRSNIYKLYGPPGVVRIPISILCSSSSTMRVSAQTSELMSRNKGAIEVLPFRRESA